jgi:hypothetical protein
VATIEEKSGSSKTKPLDFDEIEKNNSNNKTNLIYDKEFHEPLSRKVGLMNPFHFSRVVLNEDVNEGTHTAYDSITRAINLHISKTRKEIEDYKIKKEDIFNPKVSPLFRSFVGSAANPNAPQGPIAEVTAPTPASGSKTCPIVTRNTYSRQDIVDDVIQGSSVDCYLMAALYSIAWKYYSTFPPNLKPDANGNYTIQFYSYQLPPVGTSILVKPTMPLNATPVMIFAQETPDNFELWVALYEKAYAIWTLAPATDLTVPGASTNPPPRDPNVGLLPQGDPLCAMTNITKLLFTFNSTNNTAKHPSAFNTATLSTPGTWGTTSYDILNNINNTGTGATLYATVAWTYDSPPAAYPEYYGNAVLAASHAYSVLGIITINSINYIILRNPWGNVISLTDPSVTPLIGSLAQGTWNPDTSGLTIQLGNSPYGIFGLEKTAFDQCFAGFGWVQFTSLTGL